ncbi:MAG: ATP-binding protein [Acidimicrobiales bacterium]
MGGALRGREPELSLLSEVLRSAERGRWAGALVEGEPGIGKSCLVEEVSSRAGAAGMRLFTGRAEELEWTRPFGPLLSALQCTRRSTDPRRAAIADLIVQPGGASGTVTSDPGLQFRAIDAIVDLVETEAIETPAVLVVEDLQWADPSTLLALRALSRRLAFLPFALVATARPVPRSGMLDRLVDALVRDGAVRVALGALSGEAVSQLVTDVLGGPPGERLMSEVAGAAGNPLFVLELVTTLDQEGAIARREGVAEVTEVVLPPDLRLTIIRHLAFLSEPALAALRAGALLGVSFAVNDLVTTTGEPASSLVGPLQEAVRAGVLTDSDEGRMRFRHELIRDAIYGDLPQGMRAALHRDVARRLADGGAPARQVAEHYARSGSIGDATALDWICRAARASASPDVAADLIERALTIAGPQHPDWDRLLVERATLLFWGGRVGEAETVLRELFARPHDASVEGIARAGLAKVLMAGGRAQDALRETDFAMAAGGVSDAEVAQIGAWAAHPRLVLGDLDGALALATKAKAQAEAVDDQLTVCIALCAICMVHAMRGPFSEAARYSHEAMEIADRSPGHAVHRFHVGVFHGLTLLILDRVADGVAALQHGQRMSERTGARWNVPLYHAGLTLGRYVAGAWDDAIAEHEAALEVAVESGTFAGLLCNNAVRSLIALHQGDLPTARQAVAAAEHDLAAHGPQYGVTWMMRAKAGVLAATGELDAAAAVLGDGWDVLGALQMKAEMAVLGPDLVRVSLVTSSRSRADAVATTLEEIAAAEPWPWLTGAALVSRGLVEQDVGVLLAAADAYRTSPRPLERALAMEDAAAALAAGRRGVDAPRLFEEAATIYQQLGAAWDAARVEAALRALGVRRGRRGPRGRPSHGWDSLTGTEWRVVGLVGDGLSNRGIADRLFVSPRTVQSHLTHIFTKLGLATRAELTAAATRRALEHPRHP